jgi:hypothetical protein
MSDVRVEPPKPPSWWEKSSIQRAIDVASGRIPTALQGAQGPQKPQYGINYLGQQLETLGQAPLKAGFNFADFVNRTFSGRPVAPAGRGMGDLMYDPVAAQSVLGTDPNFDPRAALGTNRGAYTGQQDFPQPGSPFYTPGAEQEYNRAREQARRDANQTVEEPQVTDWLAEAMGMLGGGPDYSGYRASLEDMVLNPETGLSPRLQAMYTQLANEAGANQQRISDIYGGATGNVGAAYDTSAANIADAFTSAQQQGADQMARLGIEEAAGQVIPQAAGQQASALAALEQGRAGGLSALERYGASSGDFASQMGQAAQQRGVEQNEFLLGALQRQLADSQLMEAQGSFDARLRAPGLARDLYEASQLGQPQGLSFDQELALNRFGFEQGQAGADIQLRAQQNRNERYQQLFEFYNGDADKANEQLLFEIDQGRI